MVIETAGYDDLLQEGIYFREGQRPGEAFAMIFLAAQPGAEAFDIGVSLYSVWTILDRLRVGVTPEFPGHTMPTGRRMSVLVAYGAPLFGREGISVPRPTLLEEPFTPPAGGQPFIRGSGIPWAPGIENNVAATDIALQIIGPTQLAVARAIVETGHFIRDSVGLRITGWFTGFQRDDGRSWLGFHDGVSNLPSGLQRKQVIIIDPSLSGAPDGWSLGGTYLAYIRTSIDIALWRALAVADQELLVGRSKASGCALVSRTAAVPGCPATGSSIGDPGNSQFREPPAQVDQEIRSSHVQRANQHRPHDRIDSSRIFRQGFEYLDGTSVPDGFETGLNFVSFQNTPQRLIRVLTQPGWLGGVNFGGEGEVATLPILHARAAGLFVVPPRSENEYLPGSHLFGDEEELYGASNP